MTVLSFFVPIIVLMAAFVIIGSQDTVSWWRVSLGGLLCGAAVCGMHYLGNASIKNYSCSYAVPNLVGSAIIAVAASTIALAMFFMYRAMWANIWWKRLRSALLLAAAVSGMHWCAASGTEFRLRRLRAGGRGASADATVIAVISLVSFPSEILVEYVKVKETVVVLTWMVVGWSLLNDRGPCHLYS
jgi:NO-binding membrane sensor protein with MHYT domain